MSNADNVENVEKIDSANDVDNEENAEHEDILEIAKDLVIDQDLSEEDTEEIIEAARKRSKIRPLTHDEVH